MTGSSAIQAYLTLRVLPSKDWPVGRMRKTEHSFVRPDSRGGFPYVRSDDAGGFLFQLLGLIVSRERINQRLQFAVHHRFELVDGESDAVIGETVLREVVGAD